MAVELRLTEEEASYVVDIIDHWIAGHDDAFDDTFRDDFEDPEDFARAIAGLREQVTSATDIKHRLKGLIDGRHTPSNV